MKNIAGLLIVTFALFLGLSARGQGGLSISGTIADDKGVTLPGATVFLSGTKLMTATDEDGKFSFGKLSPGTYQLSVKMIGFEAYTQSVVVKGAPVIVYVTLKVKTNDLSEVTIRVTDPKKRESYYNKFRNAFLGRTENGLSCDILNPEVLAFKFDKDEGILQAEASDILIIENKNLGYRIKYLLKYFIYDQTTHRTLYNGETSFEDLPGKPSDQKRWAANRAETYKYSMMHFLRSVYAGNTTEEGFLVYNVNAITETQNPVAILIDAGPLPADLSKMVTRPDSSFVSFRFNKLYLVYAPASYQKKNVAWAIKHRTLSMFDKGTVISLMAPEAVIDRRGSYANFKTFAIESGIAEKCVGDQLPFEYQP